MVIIKSISFEQCENYIAASTFSEDDDNKNSLGSAKKVLNHIIANQLSCRQKEVALLYFYEKRNIPQIALLLGVNKSTVSRTLARALRNINDKMMYCRLR